jgi:predicted GNAT superfamily acetyltransferase
MTTSTAQRAPKVQARHAAEAAAARAGVSVDEIVEVADLKEAARLLAHIWSTGEDRPPVSSDLLRAFAHNGNYVAGAHDGDRIVGVSVGFLALTDGSLKLHSHITGIAPDAQGRSIGFALKQHQRRWALERAVETVTWTFDPLVRRNAWFNLAKLGATITHYHPHFYGAMEDGVNAGDESDRCVVEWGLTTIAAWRASEGTLPLAVTDALVAQGATAVLEAGTDGRPHLNGGGDGVRLCWVPDDIVVVRGRDTRAALEWRRALRTAFTDALDAGLAATAMTRDGWYVLTPALPTREP